MTSAQRLMSRAMRSRHGLGRAALRVHAELACLLPHVGIGQRRDDVAIEDGEDVLRQAGGRRQGIPARHDVIRQAALLRGRHVRQQRISLVVRRRDDADLVVRQGALEGGVEVERQVDVAAQHAGDEVGRGAVGDDGGVDSGHLLEQMRRQVLRRAGIDGAEIELARVLLGVSR